MALLIILEEHDSGGMSWNGERDTLLWYEVTVGIWVSIKGVVNKYYEGRTYAYDLFESDLVSPKRTLSIDAGAAVSCECGINMFAVWIGEEIFEHEIYVGTTKKDWTWGMCCGGNHLLAGTGRRGWFPAVHITTPLENSTCTLDDGTVCTVANVGQDNIWDMQWESLLDLIIALMEKIEAGEMTYEEMMRAIDR